MESTEPLGKLGAVAQVSLSRGFRHAKQPELVNGFCIKNPPPCAKAFHEWQKT